jgi:GNAT superfamily N-acetyltransferase
MENKITFKVRNAKVDETEDILSLIKQLADYERLSNHVSASGEMIRKYGFGENNYFQTLLVENRKNNSPRFLGFALYFYTFSTFLGKPSLYLEDLFVLPDFRGQGIGKALLKELANIALERECGRMEWAVLNWNKPAINFYKEIGAVPMDEWTVYRLTMPQIRDLAR